ncbi:MAG TPA: hypothetical protein PKW32_13295, partial [Verrucomicrobiota bacterium]|nr:hypothetical protein [Verrucomicrobiota bacterium]
GGGLTGVTRLTPMSEVQNMVRQFFTEATGINFGGTSTTGGQGGTGTGGYGLGGGGLTGGQYGTTTTGGGGQNVIRPMFFNDRTGVLFVRATLEELDLIDQAIQALNFAPPQVNLEAKFVEISQDDNKALGFDWIIGNFLFNGGKVGAQGGSAPQFGSPITEANPVGYFPIGMGPGTGDYAPKDSDGALFQSSGTPIATITGIMTDPQFRVVIRALEERQGVDVMNAPNVTTLSGRQAQIMVTVQRQILAGVSATTSQPGGTTTTTGGGVVQQAAAVPILQPEPIAIPTGPTLDVIPYVSADGYTIQMTLIPSILDFLGYGNPDIPEALEFEKTVQAQSGQSRSPIPLPRFLIRQVTTSATVWDGQTVVLGGLISDKVTRTRKQVPILGDLPVLGRLFRSENNGTAKKNLVIFVTAKIVDPAGNRVHTDDNLPYDPNLVPIQRTVSTAR